MRLLILFFLFPLFLFSQTQIGNDIDGQLPFENSGYSVSSSSDGSIVAIGSPSYDGASKGLVRVFEKSGGTWAQIGEDIAGEQVGDHFGSSISISDDGSIVAIGSPEAGIAGYASVYQNIDEVWTQIDSNILGDAAYDNFGTGVSLSNDGTVLSIIGANYCRIYENISGNWTQIGSDIMISSYGGNRALLSGDGSVVAISTKIYYWWYYYLTQHSVYKHISGTWTQIGDPINSWQSASSLSDDGSTIAVNSPTFGVEVYKNDLNVWTQIGSAIGIADYNSTCISLSSNGDVIAIEGDATVGSERVSIHKLINNDWIQIGHSINGANAGDNFGSSLKLSGDGTKLIVGAPNNDNNGENAGHARIYDLTVALSINESTMHGMKLYPNPATHLFTIALPMSQTLEKVNIYDNLGQFIQTSNNQIIKTSDLSSGLYYVEVITSTGKATKKLIIN